MIQQTGPLNTNKIRHIIEYQIHDFSVLFTHLSQLVLLLGVKCLKFFLKLFQYVFSQDIPLQLICSPSPQINDLKHRDGVS